MYYILSKIYTQQIILKVLVFPNYSVHLKIICFSELLKNADKTTNIQKPPVYKHVLPRVLESTTNNEYCNNYHDNKSTTKLPPMSPSPPVSPSKQSSSYPFSPIYDVPKNNCDAAKERQARVDRILEKYRRQPSSTLASRQFLRSFSLNSAPESSETDLIRTTKTVTSYGEVDNKSNSGPRSVSPYALFDHPVRTSSASACHGCKADIMSLLPKSNSLKCLGEYRSPRTYGGAPSVDYGLMSKLNTSTHISNDDDTPSSASSTSSTTTKTVVPKDDTNNHSYRSPSLSDCSVGGNCNEETVSDRIRRRSFYVKLK